MLIYVKHIYSKLEYQCKLSEVGNAIKGKSPTIHIHAQYSHLSFEGILRIFIDQWNLF